MVRVLFTGFSETDVIAGEHGDGCRSNGALDLGQNFLVDFERI